MSSLALTVDVRAAEVLSVLRNGEKRIRYSIVNALNGAAKLGQAAERARVASTFTPRGRREFILRQAAIVSPFASVSASRYFVRISVGQKRRLLLPLYQLGGERRPFVGKRVAIPVIGGARAAESQDIPLHLYIQRLRLRRVKSTTGGRGAIRGLERTFIVPRVGIFQRRGPKDIQPLYIFATGVVELRPVLKFLETVGGVAMREFPVLLQAEIQSVFRREAARVVSAAVSAALGGVLAGAFSGAGAPVSFSSGEDGGD